MQATGCTYTEATQMPLDRAVFFTALDEEIKKKQKKDMEHSARRGRRKRGLY